MSRQSVKQHSIPHHTTATTHHTASNTVQYKTDLHDQEGKTMHGRTQAQVQSTRARTAPPPTMRPKRLNLVQNVVISGSGIRGGLVFVIKVMVKV